ncbi:MAG: ATP-binding protein [Deltaproteobacteria bacterium]|nr:ATP-binding protein [Deltaproteobacteria bacterium]
MSLLSKPINNITWEDVEAFCQERTPEGAVLDYKEDFPNNLERSLAAMANTLGGLVLIGIEEDKENRPIIPVKGIEFKRGLAERVTNIILSNITPPFIPEIAVPSDATKERALVVIRIAQSHQTPHAIAANTQVYLRTGNRNKPEELATIPQIEWLMDGRRKSEEFRAHLYKQAEVRLTALRPDSLAARQKAREATAIAEDDRLMLSLCPVYPKDRLMDPPAMYGIYRGSEVDIYKGYDSIFPPVQGGDGRIVQDGFVRQRVTDDGGIFHVELNSFGLYFYRQSIVNVYPDNPRKVIYSGEISRRLDEFLESSSKYYRQLGYRGTLEFRMVLNGVKGCVLREFDRNSYSFDLNSPDNEIRFLTTVTAASLSEEKPRLVLGAAQQVAWAFNWSLTPEHLDRYYKEKRRESVLFPVAE